MIPTTSIELAKCKPIYETHPGFKSLTDKEWISMADRSRNENMGFDVLSPEMHNYIKRIEHLAGVPIVSIGVGPDRSASIASTNGPFDLSNN